MTAPIDRLSGLPTSEEDFYYAGFAQGGWGSTTQHAVTEDAIEASIAPWVSTVKAVCGAWVGPLHREYGASYHCRCRNCERKVGAS
jgi:hypothetical protein